LNQVRVDLDAEITAGPVDRIAFRFSGEEKAPQELQIEIQPGTRFARFRTDLHEASSLPSSASMTIDAIVGSTLSRPSPPLGTIANIEAIKQLIATTCPIVEVIRNIDDSFW